MGRTGRGSVRMSLLSWRDGLGESAKRKKVGDIRDEDMEKDSSTVEADGRGQTSEMDGTVQSYGDERVISSQRSIRRRRLHSAFGMDGDSHMYIVGYPV